MLKRILNIFTRVPQSAHHSEADTSKSCTLNKQAYFIQASRSGFSTVHILREILRNQEGDEVNLKLLDLSYPSRTVLAGRMRRSGLYSDSEIRTKSWTLRRHENQFQIIGCKTRAETVDLASAIARSIRRKLVHVTVSRISDNLKSEYLTMERTGKVFE
jgi:predicted GTPase